jgi:hypothetical protein
MARKEHNIHYIYKTTCNVTGKYYVGMRSTSNENDDYLGSGLYLRRSVRKHGTENHTKEILSYHDTRELLIEAEKSAITDDMVLDKDCMNLKLGGTGGWASEEVQLKCSKAGGKASMAKFWTDDTYKESKLNGLKKASARLAELGSDCVNNRFKDKIHSEATKQLMSEKRQGQGSGEANSQYGSCWITKEGINKKIKKEDLEKYYLEGWLKGRK